MHMDHYLDGWLGGFGFVGERMGGDGGAAGRAGLIVGGSAALASGSIGGVLFEVVVGGVVFVLSRE